MTSILTNTAAMAALQTLRAIDDNMETTQGRVSSGLRVGEASDNAAYWSIATTMRSDNMALSAVQDALGLGAAKVDTAYAGMESAIDVVKEIKAKVVAATEEGVDKAKVQEEIAQLQDQLMSIAESASFSGENWIAGGTDTGTSTLDGTVVSSFVRASDGTVSVKTTTYTLDGSTAGSM
ncbi:flagellin, partial [Sinorhizobium fredii USDA 205]